MSKYTLCALFLLTLCAVSVHSDDALKPIGYFFATPTLNAEGSSDHAKFLRDGKEYDAQPGMEVYAGDTLVTDATGDMSIAFLDGTAIRLLASSAMKLNGVGDPLKETSTSVSLTEGHASVFTPAHSSATVNLTQVHAEAAAPRASSTSKFDVFVTKDASGNFVATVAVLGGSATLTPRGASTVDITSLNQAIMTLNTPVNGVGTTPVTLSAGNLTKDQVKTLQKTSVSEIDVQVTPKGVTTMKATIHEADGTIATGTLTEINKLVSKDKWTTKANGKTVATWTEDLTKVAVSRVYDGYTLKAGFKKPTDTGTATLTGAKGIKYTGTITYDPKTGAYTFTTTKPAKDGSTAIFKYIPSGVNGVEQDLIITPSTGNSTLTQTQTNLTGGTNTVTTQPGTVVNGVFVPSGPGTTTQSTFPPGPPAPTVGGTTLAPDSPPVTQ